MTNIGGRLLKAFLLYKVQFALKAEDLFTPRAFRRAYSLRQRRCKVIVSVHSTGFNGARALLKASRPIQIADSPENRPIKIADGPANRPIKIADGPATRPIQIAAGEIVSANVKTQGIY
jgi:hypothetical protein